MKYAIFLAATMLVPAAAQSATTSSQCFNQAKTQLAMNMCASNEAAQADADLNMAYKALLAAVAAHPSYLAKLKAMQKAWLAYRDSYLNAMFPEANKQGAYGSSYPMNAALARAALTQQQVTALERLAQSFKP